MKGFRFDVINLIGKDEELVDCPVNDGKPAYTDRPITHTYLHDLNQASFGQDDSFMTVGKCLPRLLTTVFYTRLPNVRSYPWL